MGVIRTDEPTADASNPNRRTERPNGLGTTTGVEP
ncbi:hypothetical protein HALLA_13775 [Halostagnicola larsenii XH-48]|uniref:Uncharacterized protein n=1 Tax=Halostagnicola larsenii XH-48 TaxID=797299 RepID=W0JVF5_9EURY|nr:hypothetical protein HALLA_13775 [Halostagnicola larsenii XH-48]